MDERCARSHLSWPARVRRSRAEMRRVFSRRHLPFEQGLAAAGSTLARGELLLSSFGIPMIHSTRLFVLLAGVVVGACATATQQPTSTTTRLPIATTTG